MANILHIAGRSNTYSPGNTYWLYPGDAALQGAPDSGSIHEAQIYVKMRAPGNWSNLALLVQTNTLSVTTSVVSRKNQVNGNQVLSIGSGVTGEVADTTNIDSVSDGDFWCWELSVPAGSGSMTAIVLGAVFTPAVNTSKLFINSGAPTVYNAGGDRFLSPAGSTNVTATEGNAQLKCKIAGSWKDLQVNVYSNTDSVAATLWTRRNGGDGSQSVSISSGTNGLFEDTANTDTVSADDLLCYRAPLLASATHIAFGVLSSVFTNTVNQFILANQRDAASNTTPNNTTRYFTAGGLVEADSTEANRQITTRTAFTASKLGITINTNSLTANSTFDLRVNGASSSLTLSIGSGATGTFEDTSDSVTILATDKINYRLVAGATGTSIAPSAMWVVGSVTSTGGGHLLFGMGA